MALAAEVKSQEGKVRRTEGDGRRDPIADLWGANYYPGLCASQCIEFTALINIGPRKAIEAWRFRTPARATPLVKSSTRSWALESRCERSHSARWTVARAVGRLLV